MKIDSKEEALALKRQLKQESKYFIFTTLSSALATRNMKSKLSIFDLNIYFYADKE
tara:strand:+ start:603 stop:770 length:168 start_codon:yes stop_codon:yes gene_type:complete